MHEVAYIAFNIAKNIAADISNIGDDVLLRAYIAPSELTMKGVTQFELDRTDIYKALLDISIPLGRSYLQVKMDIQDPHRHSWAGTAHEIRQIISSLLEALAPDTEVRKQPWYTQEKASKGPTQKQRAQYIIRKRKAGSNEEKIVKLSANLDDWIGNLVRETYSRASDAAHRFKEQKEAIKILRYFEAFAEDLLNLG